MSHFVNVPSSEKSRSGQNEFKNDRNVYNNQEGNANDDDEEEDEDDSLCQPNDRIRRSYHVPSQRASNSNQRNGQQESTRETIRVDLDEGYFASERRLFVESLANVRQKLNSLRMFNPAKNAENVKQQQQEWSEKVSIGRELDQFAMHQLKLTSTLSDRFLIQTFVTLSNSVRGSPRLFWLFTEVSFKVLARSLTARRRWRGRQPIQVELDNFDLHEGYV